MARFLITGGAGFIGCNTTARLLSDGHDVAVLDNMSRRGAQANLDWLREQGPLAFHRVDLRNAADVQDVFADEFDAVIHLAGQVAVTTSVANPREDLEINVLGTFNLLEAIRHAGQKPLFIYASTNKVYGGMEELRIVEREDRYACRDYPGGVPETAPLDFHSPYGCSKGAADQYVRDYNRIYGIPTVVFRQSCIYGERQFGVEDQGWVAWFVIAAALGRPITIYGDGKQVRDVLFVEDLVDAYLMAYERPAQVTGRVYNVGGGPQFTMSVWREFGPILEEALGRRIEVTLAGWRPGDQPVYVSDIGAIARDLGWRPKTDIRSGVRRLVGWVEEHKDLLRQLGL